MFRCRGNKNTQGENTTNFHHACHPESPHSPQLQLTHWIQNECMSLKKVSLPYVTAKYNRAAYSSSSSSSSELGSGMLANSGLSCGLADCGCDWSMTDGQEGEGMGGPMKDHMKEKRMMNVENEQNIFEKRTMKVMLADGVTQYCYTHKTHWQVCVFVLHSTTTNTSDLKKSIHQFCCQNMWAATITELMCSITEAVRLSTT